jgi:hypothetical protein
MYIISILQGIFTKCGNVNNIYLLDFLIIFSNTENYSALLVLSERAKLLVKHPNTIMLRTISAILKCNLYDVLVLSYHLDDENIYYE